MKQMVALVILDGWGVGSPDESNPIYKAEPKAMNYLQANFPAGALQASGIAVGLPYDEEGNSEVGHLTIGAGRVLEEHFPEISSAIRDGSFFKNKVFLSAIQWVKEKKSNLHFAGLLTEANVHASLKHLAALIRMAKENGVDNFYLHVFSDGRDSAPESVPKLVGQLSGESGMDITPHLASISGRYYAMDRDKHWKRTKQAYDALVGEAPLVKDVKEAVQATYEKNLDDEYVAPSVLGIPHPIQSGDAVFFFDFREDRMRQIVAPFADPSFSAFEVKPLTDLFVATMTTYDKTFKIPVAFPDEPVRESLGEVLSKADKIQLRVAETEKYAHVTYFFNGLREEPFPNEYRILVPSRGDIRHDEHPEMMAHPITDRVVAALSEGTFDFVLVNYANPDMVAHTGNYEATLEAVRVIDHEIGRLVETALPLGHTVLLTSDHGNAEVLLDLKTGEPETKHNANPVPFYLIGKRFRKKRPTSLFSALPVVGMLSDVAPTVLDLMKIPKPKEMTGQSLLPELLEEV